MDTVLKVLDAGRDAGLFVVEPGVGQGAIQDKVGLFRFLLRSEQGFLGPLQLRHVRSRANHSHRLVLLAHGHAIGEDPAHVASRPNDPKSGLVGRAILQTARDGCGDALLVFRVNQRQDESRQFIGVLTRRVG